MALWDTALKGYSSWPHVDRLLIHREKWKLKEVIKDKKQPKCTHGATGSCCEGTSMQILPSPSFGKSDRGWGSCSTSTNHPLPNAPGRTFGHKHLISSGCCLRLQLSPVRQHGWYSSPGDGGQQSRAGAKGGRTTLGTSQPLAEPPGTTCWDMGYLGHQGTFPLCGESKLTWLLRVHQSSGLPELKMRGV